MKIICLVCGLFVVSCTPGAMLTVSADKNGNVIVGGSIPFVVDTTGK